MKWKLRKRNEFKGRPLQGISLVIISLLLLCSPVNNLFASGTGTDPIANELQQAEKITGKVVDKNGDPLPGVTVAVKNTTNGTISDVDGNYSLTLQSKNSTLVFSYMGFVTQEISVNGRTTIDVTMSENEQVLDEVVVTALGIKRQKRSLGYATTNVGGDQFTESRDPNLGNALSGKIAGVSVAGNATGLGGSSRVVIRGNASMTGNNQPLYVIDGIPFDNTNQGSAGKWGGMDMGDGLSNINPDDIEDIQVLKGAAASALYGYRGGNGVIMITTKSGKSSTNGIGIEFNNNLTFNNIYDYRDFQKVYGQGSQEVKPESATSAYNTYNSSWGSKMDGSDAVNILGDTYAYSYIDNWPNFYRTGITNQTSLSISGSDKKVDYRLGISNSYDKSILPNANSGQQGINLNATFKVTSKLKAILNANYVFEKVKGRANLSDGNGNVNATLMYLANSYDVRWLKGEVNADGSEMQPGNNVYFNNPYYLQYRKSNESNKNRFTGGLTLRYDVTDWLYAQGAVTRDGFILDFKQVQPNGAAADPNGYINEYEKNYSEMNINYLIGFNKKISDFSVAATIGGNKQRNIDKTYGTDGGIRPFVIPGFYSTSNVAAETRTFKKIYKEYQVNSIYGTADFSYKEWLFLNLTGRNDWFSTLSPDNNSYFYPSVSLSYMFSDCFKMPDWLASGKLRLSYATASNGTTPYMTALAYTMKNFAVQGQSMGTVNNSTVPNANLKPVEISEWEVGTNLLFINNRLGLDFSVYQKKTKDDIVQVTTSSASGYGSSIQNVGEIRNTGIELLVYGVPVKTTDFIWNTSINLAHNSSEVLYLGEGVSSFNIDGAVSRSGNATITNIVGNPYGQIIGYKYKTDDAGNRIFDSNGLPIRDSQISVLGDGVYKLTGGFRNDFTYKNWTLAFLIDFKFGAKLFSGTNYNLYSTGLHKNTLEGRDGGIIGKGVTESGAVNTTSVDAQTYWQYIASNNFTEEFVYDASFIKLRELSLGYKLPRSLFKKTPIQSIGISLVARNLWTIHKETPNIDPESAYNNGNGQGLELNGYPATRNIGFNINVKF